VAGKLGQNGQEIKSHIEKEQKAGKYATAKDLAQARQYQGQNRSGHPGFALLFVIPTSVTSHDMDSLSECRIAFSFTAL